jgi:4-amino-4-deoxy-L-arabinose transferase-like glycosyltransferase
MALVSIVPGYLLLSLDKRLNDVERLGAAMAISFILIGGASLLLHSAGFNILYSLLTVVPIVFYIAWKKVKVTFNVPRMLLLALFIAVTVRFILQFFFNVPMVGDSYFHMDMARTFTTDRWFEVDAIDNLWSGIKFPFPEEYRPPFFNFVMGFFFNIFETSFYIGKILNVIIGGLLVVPTYMIARKFGSEKASVMAALFIALNPLIISQSLETEVRIFASFLSLLSFYFFMKGEAFWSYSGALLGLVFMTHYAPAFILIVTYMVCIILFYRKIVFSRKSVTLILSFLVIASPWLVRNQIIYGDAFYSSSRSVGYVTEFDKAFSLEKPDIGKLISMIEADPQRYIFIKTTNLLRTFLPVPFEASHDNFTFNPDPGTNHNIMLSAITMLVTPTVFIFFAMYAWSGIKRFFDRKNVSRSMILLYIAIGIVISLIFWNFRSPSTHNFLYQFLFIIAGLGFVQMSMMKISPIWTKVTLVSIVLFLLAQIPAYNLRLDARTDFGQDWIKDMTEPDEIIMLRWTNIHAINLLTDRKIVAMPFEDEDRILQFARENGINYLVIDSIDTENGRLSIDSLKKKLDFVGEYKIREPEYSREYTNTYWMFRVF